MKPLTLIIALLAALSTQAQVTIEGTVLDKSNKQPLENVIVTIKGNGRILKYGHTEANGGFSFQLPNATDTLEANFSLMSYKKLQYRVEGKSQRLNVELEPTTMQLKEVTIKAKKIGQRGDTLTYNVASFASAQDRSIGDVLKKMPGIQVQKDGQISYNGVSINKFYIEGKDLLEGRYGIATNGISYQDVGTVEVMENHQPVRALQDVSYSEQAAINLKLKEKVKAKWIVNAEGAAGYSNQPQGALWDARLFAMMFNKRFQQITTARSNNIGESLEDYYRDYLSKKAVTEYSDYLKPVGIRSADLEQERTLMNRSHLFSTSSLWGDDEKLQAKLQVNYLNNREAQDYQARNIYQLSDGTRIVDEQENTVMHQHLLSAHLSLEKNAPHIYIKNRLKGNCNWNNYRLHTQSNQSDLQQEADLPTFQADNQLDIVKRIKGQALTIESYNQFKHLPQDFSVIGSEKEVKQTVRSNQFYTNENVSYSIPYRRWVFSLQGGLQGLFRTLETELKGLEAEQYSNDLHTHYLQLHVGPKVEYLSGKYTLTFNCPVQYYHYTFGEWMGSKNDVFFSPSLGLHLKLNKRLNFSASGNIRQSSLDLKNLYPHFILTNYRTLRQGTDAYATGNSRNVSTTLMYKNPENETFASVTAIHTWNKNPYLNSQTFDGNYLIQSLVEQENRSRTFLLLGNFSNCIDLIRGTFEVNVNYMQNKASMWSGSSVIPYRSGFLTLNTRLTGNLFQFVNWSYQLEYGTSSLKPEGSETTRLHQMQHAWGLYTNIGSKLQLQTTGEYYHNEISAKTYKDMCMVNSAVKYQLSDRIELTMNINNILNHKAYRYALYSELNTLECTRSLRGREFLVGFCFR